MAAAHTPPPKDETDPRVAVGRPAGVGATSYGIAALSLLDLGYQPLPIKPAAKTPAPTRWSSVVIDEAQVEAWGVAFPAHGVGLRTGGLVGIDIDILDPDPAHAAEAVARRVLGETPLLRVGLWPKRLLIYRTDAPFRKLQVPGLEILGQGQQFVAFGIHPGTGQPYHWPEGDTPLDVAFDDLPRVVEGQCAILAAEIAALSPDAQSRSGGRREPSGGVGSKPVRDADGRVVDGRDGWLSSIAYHAVHDALDRGAEPDAERLAQEVVRRFEATADLSRPAGGSPHGYGLGHARRKVGDKLRLHREGRLPPRASEPVDADYAAPTLGVNEARAQLDRVIADACHRLGDWRQDEAPGPPPQIGIRATVGLGKSVVARFHALALQQRLALAGKPSRIVVLTPSHALAQETADAWAADGANVVVLRGYEATDPATGEGMCRALDAVHAALLAGEDVHSTACERKGKRCAFFSGCAKQGNRAEVAAADVVVAAYDVLYTGFAIEASSIGFLLIDEGCWPRAHDETRGLWVETFDADAANAFRGASRGAFERQASDLADLKDLRGRAQRALASLGPGPAKRSAFMAQKLDSESCRLATRIEAKRLRDPGLYPGMPKVARGPAIEIAKINARIRRAIRFWRALAVLLDDETEISGRIRIAAPDRKTGLHEIVVAGVKRVHPNFRGLPVLHLDATLRQELARTVLPDLTVTEIDVAAPHMHVRLVSGRFGKSMICPGPSQSPEERGRSERRLAECVDYVRWQARRFAPGRVLVVTHMDIEEAFAGIPGVAVAHFNAIAGLDQYRDVRLLVVVGRPLPPALAVRDLSAGYFGSWPADRYVRAKKGVRMRDGSVRAVSTLVSEDPQAEALRAAICDDEAIQAIGRGRGVNRTADNPLDLHVLADLALPLVHDEVVAWETVAPDLFQQMLLGGVAVDSPADAALLHPVVFSSAHQAKLAFDRAGFKAQNPMRDSYRGMSLKSAAYRRVGRGRGWQRAWWLEGDPDPQQRLQATLGPLAEWRSDSQDSSGLRVPAGNCG